MESFTNWSHLGVLCNVAGADLFVNSEVAVVINTMEQGPC
jgi:hypothetical protein